MTDGERARRIRARNLAVGLALIAFVVLVYLGSMARLSGG